jgi:hypothetical protein
MEIIKKSSILRFIIVDISILALVYILPTFSHIVGFPLYLLDPMRLAVLSSLFLLKDKNNAYILALTIPLFSFFVSGHPIFWKSILISIELIANVFFFMFLKNKIKSCFFSMFISIFFSKIVYYILKYGFVTIGLLNIEIISTSLLLQLFIALFISILFTLFYKRKGNKE